MSLILATNFLSPEARKLMPGLSCSPSVAVHNKDWDDLVVDHRKLCEEGGESSALGRIKDEEIALSVFLDFVSDPVLKCPTYWRTAGIDSVTVTAPLNTSCTVRAPPWFGEK